MEILIERNEKERLQISSKNFSEAAWTKLKAIQSQNDKFKQKLTISKNKLTRAQFNLNVKLHKNEADISHPDNGKQRFDSFCVICSHVKENVAEKRQQ